MRTDEQVNFRMPSELRTKLTIAAEEQGRSLTSEIVARLEASFSAQANLDKATAERLIEALQAYTAKLP